jgi:hypothetical protein
MEVKTTVLEIASFSPPHRFLTHLLCRFFRRGHRGRILLDRGPLRSVRRTRLFQMRGNQQTHGICAFLIEPLQIVHRRRRRLPGPALLEILVGVAEHFQRIPGGVDVLFRQDGPRRRRRRLGMASSRGQTHLFQIRHAAMQAFHGRRAFVDGVELVAGVFEQHDRGGECGVGAGEHAAGVGRGTRQGVQLAGPLGEEFAAAFRGAGGSLQVGHGGRQLLRRTEWRGMMIAAIHQDCGRHAAL